MSFITLRGRRWAGVLAIALIVGIGIATMLAAGCAKKAPTGQLYHCPMHPTYISDKPGDCPICGMRLVPMKNGSAPSAGPSSSGSQSPAPSSDAAIRAQAWICPMESDSDVVAWGPGKCPKCGMNLVPASTLPDRKIPASAQSPQSGSAASSPSGERRILYYRSPMDPKVTSPVPAKDEMGMDFVPVYEEPGQASGGTAVPGYAPVTVGQEGLRLAGVQTTPVVRGIVSRTVRAAGMVQPDERRVRTVTLKSAGYVERLFVGATGQVVRQGDPILSIYSPDLLAAQSEYLQAKKTASALSASTMPEVRKGADDLLDAARRRLELLDVPRSLIDEIDRTGQPSRTVTLTAPVSGYVTAKPVLAGMQVEPGTDLYTVTDLSRVWIEADFYESEAAWLKVGTKATLTLPYDPSVRLAGTVALIYPAVDPGSRTLRVRFETDNPGTLLKPGMYANAELPLMSSPGLVVPDDAVIDTGERQIVFVETAPGEFVPRDVRITLRGEGRALIAQGVTEGEQVVTRANFLLDSESRIRAAFSGVTP